MSNSNGSKWIPRQARLAVYLRDGMACTYCGAGVETEQLTLDHIIPRSHGGTHEATNLVTACGRCNSYRGNRSVEEFAVSVASYVGHGVHADDIVTFIHETRQRPLPLKEAKALIKRRGSYAAVLDTYR